MLHAFSQILVVPLYSFHCSIFSEVMIFKFTTLLIFEILVCNEIVSSTPAQRFVAQRTERFMTFSAYSS